VVEESHTKIAHAGKLGYSFRRHLYERFIEILLFMSAYYRSNYACNHCDAGERIIRVFQQVSIWEFLTDTQ